MYYARHCDIHTKHQTTARRVNACVDNKQIVATCRKLKIYGTKREQMLMQYNVMCVYIVYACICVCA